MELDPLELQHRTEAALRALRGLQDEVRREIREASPASRQTWHHLRPELAAALERGHDPDPETCRSLEEAVGQLRQLLARIRDEAQPAA